jgi:hypothetical protein
MSENNFSQDEKKLIEEMAKPVSFKEYFNKMDEDERKVKMLDLIQNIRSMNMSMADMCQNMIKVTKEQINAKNSSAQDRTQNNNISSEDKKQEE